MVLIAHFWSLLMRFNSFPHKMIPYVMCGRIRLLYSVFIMLAGRKCLRRLIVPIVHAIFAATFWAWGFHVMFSSIDTPRKLKTSTQQICVWFVYKLRSVFGLWSFETICVYCVSELSVSPTMRRPNASQVLAFTDCIYVYSDGLHAGCTLICADYAHRILSVDVWITCAQMCLSWDEH